MPRRRTIRLRKAAEKKHMRQIRQEKSLTGQAGSNAANQRGRGSSFPYTGSQVIQLHDGGGVTFGNNPDRAGAIGRGNGDHIQRDSSGDHPPQLMIGVVPNDLTASGRREQGYPASIPKRFFKAMNRIEIPPRLGFCIFVPAFKRFPPFFSHYFSQMLLVSSNDAVSSF